MKVVSITTVRQDAAQVIRAAEQSDEPTLVVLRSRPAAYIVHTYQDTGATECIQAMFPYLTLQQIQGALDYYAAHPARVDEDTARHERALAELQGGRWPD